MQDIAFMFVYVGAFAIMTFLVVTLFNNLNTRSDTVVYITHDVDSEEEEEINEDEEEEEMIDSSTNTN